MIIKYKKNNTTDVKLRILNNYEITKSSQEISYSDLTCDFTNHSVNDLPEKYQEVKLVEENGQVEPIWGNSTETGTIIEHNIEKEGLIKSYDIKGNTYQQTSILPNEYQQVEYIESSGTQFINTGLIGKSTMYMEGKIQAPTTLSDFKSIIGANPNRVYIQTDTNGTNEGSISANTIYEFKASYGNNAYLSINDEVVARFTNTSTYNTGSNNMYIFARNNNGTSDNKSSHKLYYIKIYDNNVLVRYFIPCYRKSDSVIGLYDIVNNTFYTNAGTGTFAKGNNVTLPTPDYPQNIENVTGLQTIEVVGKNLLDKTKITENTSIRNDNGATYSNNDSFSTDYINVNNQTNIAVSGMSNATGYLWGAFYNKDKSYVSGFTNNNNNHIVNIPNNAYYIRLGINNSDLNTLMINYGDELLTYEEYKGQKYEINLGKNLLDTSDITTTSYITNNGDGSITLNGTGTGGISFSLSNPIVLKANTTYTLSLTNTNSSYSNATFILRNGNTNIFQINYGQSSVSYTPTEDTTIDTLRIYAPNTITFNNFTFSVQLEKGSQATSYSSYFTPIELNKIGDYQDRIYKQNNKWYIEKKIGKYVFTGTESSSSFEKLNSVMSGTTRFIYNMNGIYQTNTSKVVISNCFKSATFDEIYSGNTTDKNLISSFVNISRFVMRIDNTIANSIDEFKTYLSNNPVEVDYVLATPEITEITNTDLIEQLNALIDKELNKGLNYIILNSDGELKITIKEITGEIVNDKTLFYGYVDSYNFNEMREIDKYTEMNLTLLSPMKMATLRTFSSIGTYRLKTFIQNIILQPLLNDGFVLKKLNIIDRKITVNFLSKTIEYGLNELSNDYNLWWYIDENKNIYIIDIGILLKSEPKLIYDSTHKLNGLQYLKPRIYSDNYANVINFSNVRVYEYSNWIYDTDHVSVNVNGLINSQITPIKNNGVLDFKYPVDIKKENIIKSAEDNNVSPYGDYYGLQITGKYSDNTTFELYIKYNPTNNTYTMSNNIGFDGDEESAKPFLLVRDSFFSNLIVGLKYNNESKNISSITTIRSDSALIYNIYRFFNDKAINDKKGIINDTGIVELTINMNEQWKTKSELQNIGISYINKNSLKLDGEIELKLDKNIVKVGDTIKINKLLFNDVYIVTKIQEQFNKGVFEYIVTLKNSNITENYIDLFRASQVQNEEDKIYKINIAHYSEEGIKETFEVVQ